MILKILILMAITFMESARADIHTDHPSFKNNVFSETVPGVEIVKLIALKKTGRVKKLFGYNYDQFETILKIKKNQIWSELSCQSILWVTGTYTIETDKCNSEWSDFFTDEQKTSFEVGFEYFFPIRTFLDLLREHELPEVGGLEIRSVKQVSVNTFNGRYKKKIWFDLKKQGSDDLFLMECVVEFTHTVGIQDWITVKNCEGIYSGADVIGRFFRTNRHNFLLFTIN